MQQSSFDKRLSSNITQHINCYFVHTRMQQSIFAWWKIGKRYQHIRDEMKTLQGYAIKTINDANYKDCKIWEYQQGIATYWKKKCQYIFLDQNKIKS